MKSSFRTALATAIGGAILLGPAASLTHAQPIDSSESKAVVAASQAAPTALSDYGAAKGPSGYLIYGRNETDQILNLRVEGFIHGVNKCRADVSVKPGFLGTFTRLVTPDTASQFTSITFTDRDTSITTPMPISTDSRIVGLRPPCAIYGTVIGNPVGPEDKYTVLYFGTRDGTRVTYGLGQADVSSGDQFVLASSKVRQCDRVFVELRSYSTGKVLAGYQVK